MKEILFFSNNTNKVVEVTQLFSLSAFKILSLKNFKNINSPVESGTTFEENANIKSIYGLKKFNLMCFADDSGICIDSLEGKPGVNSKDYLEKNNNQNTCLKKIINESKNQNVFSAFFQTTISLSINKNQQILFTGKINGSISKEIRGSSGFGYDPIFIPNDHNKTFAEMRSEEKNKISHRAIAMKKLLDYLSSI